MIDAISIASLSEKFSALSNSSRLKIFFTLTEESWFCNFEEKPLLAKNCTQRLASLVRLSQSTVSHHFQILKKADIITTRRKGKYIYAFPTEVGTKLLSIILPEAVLKEEKLTQEILIPENTFLTEAIFKDLVEYLQLHLSTFRFQGPSKQKQQYIRFYISNPRTRIIIEYLPWNRQLQLKYLLSRTEDNSLMTFLQQLTKKFIEAKFNDQ